MICLATFKDSRRRRRTCFVACVRTLGSARLWINPTGSSRYIFLRSFLNNHPYRRLFRDSDLTGLLRIDIQISWRHFFTTQEGKLYIKDGRSTTAFKSTWSRWMDQLAKHTNIPKFSERSIRNLVGSEDDLQTASERLGHASTTTTQKYYRQQPTKVVPLSSN